MHRPFSSSFDQAFIDQQEKCYFDWLVPTSDRYDITPAFASRAADSMRLFGYETVTHVTKSGPHVWELIQGGIDIKKTDPKNLYGKAFYLLRDVYPSWDGDTMLVYDLDRSKLKYVDERSPAMAEVLPKNMQSSLAKQKNYAKKAGYNAIRYTHMDEYHDAYAIINKPNELLKPQGVYEIPEAIQNNAGRFGFHSATRMVSPKTVTALRGLGLLGTGYSIYSSVKTIAASDTPIIETAHQTLLTTSAVAAGGWTATMAMPVCAAVGCLSAPAAWLTVPLCIATAGGLGGTAGTFAAEYVWRLPKGSFSGLLIPTAFAAPNNTQSYFPFEPSSDDFFSANNLLHNPELFSTASPEVLSAAYYLYRDSDNVFNNDAARQKIPEWQFHNRFRNLLSPAEQIKLLDSGYFGDPKEASRYYFEPVVNEMFKNNPDPQKRKSAVKLAHRVQRGIDKQKVPPHKTMAAMSALMVEEASNTLGIQALSSIIESHATSARDITGYQNDKGVVKLHGELESLIQQGAPIEIIGVKATEVEKAKLKVKLERQKFDKMLQYGGYAASILSIAGRAFKNEDMAKAAATTFSVIEIGRNVAGLVGLGSMATTIAACPLPFVAAGIAITTAILNIIDIFSNNGKPDPIGKALQQLSQQLVQLGNTMVEGFNRLERFQVEFRTETREFFSILKLGIDLIAERIKLGDTNNQRFQSLTTDFLTVITDHLQNLAELTKDQNQLNVFRQLQTRIANLKSKFTAKVNDESYSDFQIELNNDLNTRGNGVRDTVFTNSNAPRLTNLDAAVAHFKGRMPEFQLAALVEIFNQLGFKVRNYSPEMVDYFLLKVLNNKPEFQLVRPVPITDLIVPKFSEQKSTSLLREKLVNFMANSQKDGVTTFVAPLCLSTEWRLMVVNKTSERLQINLLLFAPDSKKQAPLNERLLRVVRPILPQNHTYTFFAFDSSVSPANYGPIIVQIVSDLSRSENVHPVLDEKSNNNLLALSKRQIRSFNASEELLATRQALIGDPINPLLTGLLITELLQAMEKEYSLKEQRKYNTTLKINSDEIEGVRQTLLAIDKLPNLPLAYRDERVIKTIFHQAKKALELLRSGLIQVHRQLQIEKHKKLVPMQKELFTTEEQVIRRVKEQKYEVSTNHGNWFAVTNPMPKYDDCKFSPDIAVGDYKKKRSDLLTNQTETNVEQWVKEHKELRCINNLDFYNISSWECNVLPMVVLPEQEGYPILTFPANFTAGFETIYPNLVRAQGFTLGKISFSYHVNETANSFSFNVVFFQPDAINPNNRLIESIHLSFKNNSEALNFLTGPEAVTAFWYGGKLPKKVLSSENKVVIKNCMEKVWKYGGWRRGVDASHKWKNKGEIFYLDPMQDMPAHHQGITETSLAWLRKQANSTTTEEYIAVGKLVNSTIDAFRSEENQQIYALAKLPLSSLGKARLRFSLFSIITKLVARLLNPSQMNNPNGTLVLLLAHPEQVHDDESFFAYLQDHSPQFVLDRLISDNALALAESYLLSTPPASDNLISYYVNYLRELLLQANDDLSPFYLCKKIDPAKLKVWKEIYTTSLESLNKVYREMLILAINGRSQLQPKQWQEMLDYADKINTTLKVTDQVMDEGEATLEEAVERIENLGNRLRLPSPSSGLGEVEIKHVLDERVRMTATKGDTSDASPTSTPWGIWALPARIIGGVNTGTRSLIASIGSTVSSWFTSSPQANSAPASMPSNQNIETKSTPKATPVAANFGKPPFDHDYVVSQFLFIGVSLNKLYALFSGWLPQNQQRVLTTEDTETLQSILNDVTLLKCQLWKLATSPASQSGLQSVREKFESILNEVDKNRELSLSGEISKLLRRSPEKRIITNAQINDWQHRFERMQRYFVEIMEVNEQIENINIQHHAEREKYPNHDVVAHIGYDCVYNKLSVTFLVVDRVTTNSQNFFSQSNGKKTTQSDCETKTGHLRFPFWSEGTLKHNMLESLLQPLSFFKDDCSNCQSRLQQGRWRMTDL